MFGIKLKPLLKFSEKNIIRSLRNRRQLDVNGANPGLNKRIKAFQEQGVRIEDDDAEEFMEKSDSHFHNVGDAYNEHLNETLIGKYDLQHKIVKQKYFKENMPNLLTWSEKEQIRHLTTTYPDEWSPERIAESFPVTVPIAKKLLKYPWKPATEQRIARHDASAMRNWRELKERTLSIPDDLRKHFLKFSERQIPPLNKKSIKVDLTQAQRFGEFEQIIKRCSNLDNTNSENFDKSEETDDTDNANNKELIRDPRRMTLDDLTTRIKKRLDCGSNVEIPDKIIVDTVRTEPKNFDNKIVELTNNELEENQLVIHNENDNNSISVIDYPERIRIPKKAYKKGATYKIKDCYYDHDGKFLYRVMGMSEQ